VEKQQIAAGALDVFMAGGVTIGLFLILPYTTLVKTASDPDIKLMQIERAATPVLPLPVSVPEKEHKLIKPLQIVEPEPVSPPLHQPMPLRMTLNFNLSSISADGDFDVAFSIKDAAGSGSEMLDLNMVDQPPLPLAQLRPIYPVRARMARVTGAVEVEFTVNPDGSTVNPRVLSAAPAGIFDAAALRAVERWRFKPARKDGKPVAVRVRQNIRFELE
jgi:protein TonB